MGIGAGVIGFIFFVLGALLQLLLFAIIANAILSWLFAFDVINYRNRFVAQVAEFLDRFTSPILAPLRRIIPPLGGIDLTPIVALLIIQGVQGYLLPPLHGAALGLVGAQALLGVDGVLLCQGIGFLQVPVAALGGGRGRHGARL